MQGWQDAFAIATLECFMFMRLGGGSRSLSSRSSKCRIPAGDGKCRQQSQSVIHVLAEAA